MTTFTVPFKKSKGVCTGKGTPSKGESQPNTSSEQLHALAINVSYMPGLIDMKTVKVWKSLHRKEGCIGSSSPLFKTPNKEWDYYLPEYIMDAVAGLEESLVYRTPKMIFTIWKSTGLHSSVSID